MTRLVAEMRRAQREYFRLRSTSALDRSKWLEAQVDKAVREALEQPTLFGEEA